MFLSEKDDVRHVAQRFAQIENHVNLRPDPAQVVSFDPAVQDVVQVIKPLLMPTPRPGTHNRLSVEQFDFAFVAGVGEILGQRHPSR